MRDLKLWVIVGASCMVLCHAMPQPDPEPDVNVNVNIDVKKPEDDGNDINVDVNVNIDEDDTNSTDLPGAGNTVTDGVGPVNDGSDDVGCTCGKPNKNTRIIGGSDVTTPLKYPWHVGIYYYNVSGYQYDCGGTIINNLFIISAAHCFYDWGGPSIPVHLLIGIGDHDQIRTMDDFDEVTIKASVERVHIHPEYDHDITDVDFALVQLAKPLEFGNLLRPICLPENDLKTYENETGTIVGWGLADYWDWLGPDILQEAQVIIQDPTCNNYDEYITDNMMCAAYPEKDSCSGDSGGSISVAENGNFVQVGITSWGMGCALEGHPGVYSRITSVLRWIRQVCSEAEWCPRA